MNNKYIKRSHISEAKFKDIIRYFSLDVNALKIASLTKLNRNTVNRYLGLIRERIVELCEQSSPFQGEVEVDESYFGARRIKGKRGRGAAGKTPVFGILQRGGKVYIPGTILMSRSNEIEINNNMIKIGDSFFILIFTVCYGIEKGKRRMG